MPPGDFCHGPWQFSNLVGIGQVRRTHATDISGRKAAYAWELGLEGITLAYVDVAGIAGDGKDKLLFRTGINGMAKRLTGNALTSKRICELVKRRRKDAGLPSRLSRIRSG
jgi:hypothetical protein